METTALVMNRTRGGDNDGTSTSREREQDIHRRSSHSGLSALLSAVTLQLSESGGGGHDEEHFRHGHNNSRDDENDDYVAARTATSSPNSTTPTMMPETHIININNNTHNMNMNSNHKHHNNNQSFPHTLMTLLMDPDNHNIITFLPDGKYFCFRVDVFTSTLMEKYFRIDQWESFLQTMCTWGFQPIQTNVADVEVFRHPLFRKGDWKRCNQITNVPTLSSTSRRPLSRQSSYDDRPKSSSDNTASSTESSVKRRLSPAHAEKVTSNHSSKVRIHTIDHPHHSHHRRHHDSVDGGSEGKKGDNTISNDTTQNTATGATTATAASPSSSSSSPSSSSLSSSVAKSKTATTATATTTARIGTKPSGQHHHHHQQQQQRRLSFEDCRSLAVTITTEKLQLEQSQQQEHTQNLPLVSQAVFGATHTIVTDAIETLLRDEDHTRETFQKHADELSKSSLPGLIPISKQLFCDGAAGAGGTSDEEGQTTTAPTAAASSSTSPSTST